MATPSSGPGTGSHAALPATTPSLFSPDEPQSTTTQGDTKILCMQTQQQHATVHDSPRVRGSTISSSSSAARRRDTGFTATPMLFDDTSPKARQPSWRSSKGARAAVCSWQPQTTQSVQLNLNAAFNESNIDRQNDKENQAAQQDGLFGWRVQEADKVYEPSSCFSAGPSAQQHNADRVEIDTGRIRCHASPPHVSLSAQRRRRRKTLQLFSSSPSPADGVSI
eukprot:m.22387 g.22387  ORF g.22387 m.22387 type:complete len:223 (+) comp12687_c0_seq1:2-670(+)